MRVQEIKIGRGMVVMINITITAINYVCVLHGRARVFAMMCSRP